MYRFKNQKAMETMQIRLTPSMIKDIDIKVANGEYASRSELVREAVRRILQRQKRSSYTS